MSRARHYPNSPRPRKRLLYCQGRPSKFEPIELVRQVQMYDEGKRDEARRGFATECRVQGRGMPIHFENNVVDKDEESVGSPRDRKRGRSLLIEH